MQKVDKYFVGYAEEVIAVPAQIEDGIEIMEAVEAAPENPGIECNIKLPIPFDVIMAAAEHMDGTMKGMIKTGEIVARACTVGGIPKEIVEDGQLMVGFAMECSKYVEPKGIKKNSLAQNISTKKDS